MAVAAVVFRWWAYEPIPPSFSEPTKLRCILASIKVVRESLIFLESNGLLSITTLQNHPMISVSDKHDEDPNTASVTELWLEGIRALLYRPRITEGTKVAQRRGLVFFHGGGFVFGAPESYHNLMRQYSVDMDMVVVSVAYRLAPRHIYPAGFEDALKVTKHLLQQAEEYGVDPTRVGVGGESAGANLAAAVCLKLRDEQYPLRPSFQLLFEPCLQMLDMGLPSYRENVNQALLTPAFMAWMWSLVMTGRGDLKDAMTTNRHAPAAIRKLLFQDLEESALSALPKDLMEYVLTAPDEGNPETLIDIWESIKSRALDPYLYPLVSSDLTGLPKAYIYTNQYDILRDEGLLYKARLQSAGNDVTHFHHLSSIHGILTMHFANFSELGETAKSITTFVLQKT